MLRSVLWAMPSEAYVASFFLCDLSHTSQGINSELVPYPIGCIKSYYHANAAEPAEIRLFKYPQKLLAALQEAPPAILGFSNYMWNLDLGLSIAAAVKRRHPEVLILFGGPNYPLETARQEEWLRARPQVDVVVVGEGEHPFLQLAEAWIETRSIEAVKRAGVDGVHALVDGSLLKHGRVRADGFDATPRVLDLGATPSPYLQGYLDEFLLDPDLVPLMECNRGCPFHCTYCVDGIAARSKVTKVGLERLRAELEYIAERHEGKYLTLADTNFGMFKQDVEFCRIIADVKKRYDYPHHLQVSTGKNQKERIIECAELLEGSLRFSGSVQSLDPSVLENIGRSNISYEELLEVSARAGDTQASTYSEIILALPGDRRSSHMDGVLRLVDAGFDQIRMYTLMLLEGSELSTAASRERFGLRGRYRVVPRSFGIYHYGDEELRSVEVEEVCVENDTLSFEDYIDCRRFALTVALFYNDRVFYELTQLIQGRGRKVSEWLRFVHGWPDLPERLVQIYACFDEETREELADSAGEIEERCRNEAGHLEAHIRGRRGNNLLFNAQAEAHAEAMEELHRVAFDAAANFLGIDRDAPGQLDAEFLSELERYSLARKRRFLDLEGDEILEFGFDFIELESQGFDRIPPERSSQWLRIGFETWQRDFIRHQLQLHGRSIQALGKMFSRVPIKKLQRVATRVAAGERHEPIDSESAHPARS